MEGHVSVGAAASSCGAAARSGACGSGAQHCSAGWGLGAGRMPARWRNGAFALRFLRSLLANDVPLLSACPQKTKICGTMPRFPAGGDMVRGRRLAVVISENAPSTAPALDDLLSSKAGRSGRLASGPWPFCGRLRRRPSYHPVCAAPTFVAAVRCYKRLTGGICSAHVPRVLSSTVSEGARQRRSSCAKNCP